MAWVLIVDDDASIRDSLEFALHTVGYAIVEVGDGEDALDVLRATPYHAVVLLDLLMPGMTGQKVLDLLEQDPQLACRHGWIIMSADYEALQSIPLQQRADLGLKILKKPFEMDDMLAVVAEQAERLPADAH
ncbi:MAG TPA: response regulator [Ktedonobacterales bacterium]|jgi:CheY-like chemotaxis protein|nr:response regulator [Ktedonobacterales bacterium]